MKRRGKLVPTVGATDLGRPEMRPRPALFRASPLLKRTGVVYLYTLRRSSQYWWSE
ncbi:hypothetical protein A2U01_0115354, partial [Trifolium medium]|nr:hypothetical protein [Trifolium medium]